MNSSSNTNIPMNYATIVSGHVAQPPAVPPVALCFGCLHSFPTETGAAPTSARGGNNNRASGRGGSGSGEDDLLGSGGAAASAMLRESPFGETLRRCLHQIRTHAARVEPLTDRSRESVAGLEEELKRLVTIIDDEMTQRQRSTDKLNVQLRYYQEWETHIQKQLRTVLVKQQEQEQLHASQQALLDSARAAKNASRHGADSHTSKLLERFVAQAQDAAPVKRPASSAASAAVVTNRYGAVVSHVPRRPDGMSAAEASLAAAALPSMASSARRGGSAAAGGASARGGLGQKGLAMDEATQQVFQQVSASIYQVLEGLAVTARAAIGILWLNTDETGDELCAPFLVIGRADGFSRRGLGGGSGEGTNATRIGATSSTAGAVAQTGIAVSIRRPAGNGAEETLQQALVATVRSTLIVPVFRKFHAAERVCDGALQLIAWAHGSAFTPDDEFAAVSAATLLSHIVSNYSKVFRQTWAVRPPFDPAQLRRFASYSAALDQAQGNVRDAVTTAAAVGHAGGDGTLIHRCVFGHAPVGSNKQILRQELRAAGAAAAAAAASSSSGGGGGSAFVAPKDAVRDLQRYTSTLESSWKSAVLSLSDAERRVTDLQRQLDLAKQHGIVDGGAGGLGGSYRPRTAASNVTTQAASMSPARAAADEKDHQQQQQQPQVSPRSHLMARRKSSGADRLPPPPVQNLMTTSRIDDLEAETRNRMRTAAANRAAAGKSTVFLTE